MHCYTLIKIIVKYQFIPGIGIGIRCDFFGDGFFGRIKSTLSTFSLSLSSGSCSLTFGLPIVRRSVSSRPPSIDACRAGVVDNNSLSHSKNSDSNDFWTLLPKPGGTCESI